MSTSATSAFADNDSSRLADALSRAAATFATDGRLAGPASAQDGLDDLIPSPDAQGVSAELADGGTLVALAVPALVTTLSSGAGVSALASVLEAAAAELGQAIGDVVAYEQSADLLGHLSGISDGAGGRVVMGVGVFDGDAVVATVGAVFSADSVLAGAPTDDAWGATASPGAAASNTKAVGAAVLERGLQLLADIELTVTAELGRARLAVGELLDLQPGAIIELDREAGVPIDLLVNGTLFARGEVVVVEDSFAVRVSEIASDEDEA